MKFRKITGNYCVKKHWLFAHVVRVEVYYQTQEHLPLNISPGYKTWENATKNDLVDLGFTVCF